MNAIASARNAAGRPADHAVQTVRRTFVVNIENGLHARPCAMLIKTLQRYHVSVEVTANGETVSGKSILGLMSLAAGYGTQITFTMAGDHAFQAMTEVERLFVTHFGSNGAGLPRLVGTKNSLAA